MGFLGFSFPPRWSLEEFTNGHEGAPLDQTITEICVSLLNSFMNCFLILFLKLGSSHLLVQWDSRIYWLSNYRFLSSFKNHCSHLWSHPVLLGSSGRRCLLGTYLGHSLGMSSVRGARSSHWSWDSSEYKSTWRSRMVIPLGLAQAPISLREFQLSEKLPKKRSLFWPPLAPPPYPSLSSCPTDSPPNLQHCCC